MELILPRLCAAMVSPSLKAGIPGPNSCLSSEWELNLVRLKDLTARNSFKDRFLSKLAPDPVCLPLFPSLVNLDISAMGLASGQSFYSSNVRPLLDAMAIQFKAATEKLNALVSQAPAGSHRFLQEIYDSAHVTQKRAEFVLAVYDSLWQEKSTEWRKTRFDDAVVFLKEASETIKSREAAYRVPLDRIAGWGRNTNPTRSVQLFMSCHLSNDLPFSRFKLKSILTALSLLICPYSYDFGFVWTVHSRFYWFRDLFRAADQLTSFDPCFLNIIDPMRIAIGNHAIVELEAWLAQYLKKIGVGVVSDCISAPATEPVYAYPATF